VTNKYSLLSLDSTIKFHFWLPCHNSVSTLSLLNHINIAQSTLCYRCGLQEETFLYCVRDCNFSRSIWNHVGFNHPNFFNNLEAHDWLKVGTMGSLSTTFAVIVWWDRRHRNMTCLSNDNWSLNRLLFNIESMMEFFKVCFSNNSQGATTERFIKWNNNSQSLPCLSD